MRSRDPGKEALVKQKAIEMLVSDGFEGFSMNKLAKACGISVATLYIYYKDKDDLIVSLALEESSKMNKIVLGDFDPGLPFEEGLRIQWRNRLQYMTGHPGMMLFFEQLRSSTYHEKVFGAMTHELKEVMGRFMKNATEKGEINKMPIEVYWSIAYAPLYTLIRFHQEGSSIGGKPFVLREKIIWETFDLVIKALKP